MAQTGHSCPTSGIWSGDCIPQGHKKEIALSKGETFPPCSACKGAVTWTLKQATK